MNKEQQIEEIAETICNTCKERFEISKKCKNVIEPCLAAYSHAEAIYNAGYRKIDGDNYVSRKWHDEQVVHLESELEILKSEKENIVHNYAVITKSELKEYKRQAVKAFAERLKKDTRINNHGLEFVALVDIDAELKALLKEYEE